MLMQLTSPIGIFTTDINLNITSWNDWLEKSTGLSEESVCNVHLTRIIPDIEKRGLLERFLRVLTNGIVEVLVPFFHHYLIRIPIDPIKGYEEMQQRITIAPLSDDGIIHGTLVTIEDLTDQLTKEPDTDTLEEKLNKLGSDDWLKRRDVAESLSSAGKIIISEVLRKIRLEHRNLSILSSAMRIISLSEEDVSGFLVEFLNDADHELRIYSAQMLGEKNSPAAIEALIRALDDPDANVRYHAIESLGKLRAVQSVQRLSEIALAGDFFTAFPAIDALKSIGDNRSSRLIYPLLNDEMLGQPVAEALGELGEADLVPHLVKLINANSPLLPWLVSALSRISERYQETLSEGAYIADIARANFSNDGVTNLLAYLEILSDPKELSDTISVLGWIDDFRISNALTRFLGNPDIRKQVINALVNTGPSVVDLLIAQLDGEQEVRQSAIMALGRIGDEKAVDALIPLLKDEDVAVICCGALSKIGSRKAFEDLLLLLGQENPSIRRAAIAALNSIGHPDMEKRIIQLLSDANPNVRESAIKIAGYFGFPASKTFIQKLCSDTDLNVRIAAIENLSSFEDERLLSALRCLIYDENPKIRAAVVRSLGQMESKQSYETLLNALQDKDPWVRYYAVRSMDMHGFVECMSQMKKIAESDEVAFVRLAAIEYLGHMGGQLAASILAKLSGDHNHEISMAAITALGDIHHPDALPTLVALSKSADADKKKNAIEAIGRRGGTGTSGALQWVAITEKDPVIKSSAINSLKLIGTRESVTSLLNLTSDQENRDRAIAALSGLPEEMMQVICEGLSHKHMLVRTAVVEILLRIHSPQSSSCLAGCLKHDDVNVRLATVNALNRLGNKSYMKMLMELKNNDPDPVIRKAVEDLFSVKTPGS